MLIASQRIKNALLNLKITEKTLLELFMSMCDAGNGTFYFIDFLAIGAMKRTASNTDGFVMLIEAQNMISARALLRIQIDTFMRFYAIWLVDHPNEFAKEVMSGIAIRKLKDKQGNKITDHYLVNKLTVICPWLKNVYNNLCDYVHFSNQHIYSAITKIGNDEERNLTIEISKEDQKYSEESWIEIIECFTESVNILFHFINEWTKMKNSTV